MKDTWFKVRQIGAFVLFILISSLAGMMTGKPVMMIAYGAFFLVVTLAVLYVIRNRQRHFELSQGTNPMFRKVMAIIIAILALALPLLVVNFSSFIPVPEGAVAKTLGITFVLTVAFLILNAAAVWLLNIKGETTAQKVTGYLLIVLAAIIPGAVMAGYNRTTVGIGSVYYIALVVIVLAYSSYTLLVNQD
ncbi:MAG TPA: hypothetical protein P5533_02345 [Candidatus Cloacimonadota bacterium]|nr:hypothetical protein [Candidatus Cloacimonadota bacterium]